MKLNYSTALIGLAALVLVVVRFWALPWTPLRILGLALLIPGVFLLGLARIELGRAFSVTAQARTLVTSGLYSRIRNPIYVFGGVTLAGAALWAGRPWLLLLVVLWVPLQYVRIRKEEHVLTEHFGQQYLDYKRTTWF